ncbi:MAG: hypothetical protein PHI48_04080 [Bacteroidales bacterium]|nr:hypothetical protein [Bacteroidales bacterium]
MDTKYGVNTFFSEVHVNAVDFDETFKSPEYQYVVEVKTITSNNGNGRDEMKIYTDGKLEAFDIGNWKISPIIQMPFNWTGNDDILEIQDINSKVFLQRATPDPATIFSKKDFVIDIKWVFETINWLRDVENVEHLELLNHNKEFIRVLAIYMDGVQIDKILEFAEKIKYELETLKKLSLSDKHKASVKIKIKEAIDLFNKLILKL